MTSQPSEDDAVDAATVPLNQVAVADLAAGAAAFDAWLRECSGGYVTLQRVKEVSAALPVLGNVIAAVDVCGDIATLIRNRNVKRAEIDQMLDWASLGINLIGVLPIPPGTAAARMTLRPTLGIVRQSVKNGAKELGAALVAVIAGHFTASLMGELQPFVEEAKARLKEVLAECGKEAEKHLSALAAALDAIASGRLTDPNANLRAASRKASRVSARALVHDPLDTLDNMLGAVWEVSKAGVKAEINAVVSCLPDAATGLIRTLAADVRDFIPVVKQQLARLSGDDVGTIMHMLNVLIQAIQTYEAKKHHVEATVKGNASNQARLNGEGGRTEASRYQAKTRKPGPSACKTCAKGQPAPGSTGSIGFALGDESFTHTDFVLPGVLAVEWVRAYRSNFDAHDTAGPLGPRWTTPFHASFEPGGDALIYHDASGRSVRYPLLVEGQSHYDPIERMTITRASGDEVSIGYSEQLTQTYVRYGKRFVLAKVADRAGNALTLAYTDGQLATLASSAGAVVGFTHDEAGRITHIALLDDKGQPIRTLAAYRYDDAGDLVGATDENGATRAYAYSHHLVTRYTDRTGRGMNLQWDGTHVDARAVREWADDGTFDTRLRWHDRLRLTFVTDARGNTTQQYYDIDGYPYRIVYPDRTEEWFFRDAAKNVVRHIFADGATEQFTWDGRGNLTSHTARDGRTAYYVHDERDNLTGIQDPEGHRWERYYDSKGNVVEATDPLGRVTKYEYSGAGLPVAIIDAKGGRQQIAWRPDGQMASFTDCSGKTSSWKYDARGHVIEARNAAGETTRYEYEAGQLVALIHPGGMREAFERDAEGRLLAHTDALNRRTQYRYSAAGLLAARVNALGDTLEYAWNRLGQIITLRNENGGEYRFAYDGYGRLVSEQDFDGRVTEYFREDGSGVVTHRRSGGVMQAFGYDAMGRVARRRGWKAQYTDAGRVFLEPVGGASVDEEVFAYDGFGRVLQAFNAHSGVWRAYDPVGNLEQERLHMRIGDEIRAFVYRHEYDELDARTATVRPDGHRLDWLTYGSGHVHGLLLDGVSVANFSRDDAHRETGRELGNGLTQITAYDEAGRLAHQVLKGSNRKVMERRYAYDDAGQLEQISDLRGTIRYAYDPLGRLRQMQGRLGEERFAFDPASNIQVSDENEARGGRAPVLLDNLLKQYAGTRFEYDERGNLAVRVRNGERMAFGWDSFDRMVSAGDHRMQATYRYDALGRRIAKLTEPCVYTSINDGPGYRDVLRARLKSEHGYGLTVYGWDGDTLACETDCEKRTVTHYVYEPGGFTPLLQASGPLGAGVDREAARGREGPQPFAVVAYYHCDQIGTPQELTDAAGEEVWSANYRAWGQAREVISEAARKAGIGNPLRFAGQYFDRETGLHYNRHRYYDPTSGRFISKDPIGLAGGINVYQYAPNPVGWIDPFGLAGSSLLALPAPTGSNPWMPNTPMTSEPIPAGGLTVQMAMAPGQTRPGGWATTDNIPDVDYVRNKLAVTPDFKSDVSHVQTFHVPESVQVQRGTVGPQKCGCKLYPGGGSQLQILNFADRAKLVPVGPPRAIK